MESLRHRPKQIEKRGGGLKKAMQKIKEILDKQKEGKEKGRRKELRKNTLREVKGDILP